MSKYLIIAAFALLASIAAVMAFAPRHEVKASPAFWVCSETSPNPQATCTPSATKTPKVTVTPTPSMTPIVVTATATPTRRPTKTPTEEATATPVIIIVTATSTPGNPQRRSLCPEGTVCGPDTGSAGLVNW